MLDVDPPNQVIDAFNEVSRAKQDLERIQQRWQQRPALHWHEAPEDLIRADRDR